MPRKSVVLPSVASVLMIAALLSLNLGTDSSRASTPPPVPALLPLEAGDPSAGAVPSAACHTGRPEPGVQGAIPLPNRQSGDSTKGYSCNLTLIGQYQGQGSSWVSASYGHCAYLSTAFPGNLRSGAGVRVVDAADQAHPVLSDVLTSPAMASGTWESLKVNQTRGLLAAVSGGAGEGAGLFDVYDVSHDCAHPRLLNSVANTALTLPANVLGHEGGWSPDGKTYWAAGSGVGGLTAIDVSDPSRPRVVWTGITSPLNHGFSISDDGNHLYISDMTLDTGGIDIFDVSQIQRRAALPQVSFVGGLHWQDGGGTQGTIPITSAGHPYLITFDELHSGGVRVIDIGDPRKPKVVRYIRLQAMMPSYAQTANAETAGDGGGDAQSVVPGFGYDSHYCSVDHEANPTKLACGWFQSGIRVFDISRLFQPIQSAYFNPPAQVGKSGALSDSFHAASTADMTADWCSSPPSFVDGELWVTCQDNGFLILRFD